MILTCQETMSEYFRVVLCKTVQTIKLTEQVSLKLFGCLAKFCSSWTIVSKWLNNKTRYIIENKLIEIFWWLWDLFLNDFKCFMLTKAAFN